MEDDEVLQGWETHSPGPEDFASPPFTFMMVKEGSPQQTHNRQTPSMPVPTSSDSVSPNMVSLAVSSAITCSPRTQMEQEGRPALVWDEEDMQYKQRTVTAGVHGQSKPAMSRRRRTISCSEEFGDVASKLQQCSNSPFKMPTNDIPDFSRLPPPLPREHQELTRHVGKAALDGRTSRDGQTDEGNDDNGDDGADDEDVYTRVWEEETQRLRDKMWTGGGRVSEDDESIVDTQADDSPISVRVAQDDKLRGKSEVRVNGKRETCTEEHSNVGGVDNTHNHNQNSNQLPVGSAARCLPPSRSPLANRKMSPVVLTTPSPLTTSVTISNGNVSAISVSPLSATESDGDEATVGERDGRSRSEMGRRVGGNTARTLALERRRHSVSHSHALLALRDMNIAEEEEDEDDCAREHGGGETTSTSDGDSPRGSPDALVEETPGSSTVWGSKPQHVVRNAEQGPVDEGEDDRNDGGGGGGEGGGGSSSEVNVVEKRSGDEEENYEDAMVERRGRRRTRKRRGDAEDGKWHLEGEKIGPRTTAVVDHRSSNAHTYSCDRVPVPDHTGVAVGAAGDPIAPRVRMAGGGLVEGQGIAPSPHRTRRSRRAVENRNHVRRSSNHDSRSSNSEEESGNEHDHISSGGELENRNDDDDDSNNNSARRSQGWTKHSPKLLSLNPSAPASHRSGERRPRPFPPFDTKSPERLGVRPDYRSSPQDEHLIRLMVSTSAATAKKGASRNTPKYSSLPSKYPSGTTKGTLFPKVSKSGSLGSLRDNNGQTNSNGNSNGGTRLKNILGLSPRMMGATPPAGAAATGAGGSRNGQRSVLDPIPTLLDLKPVSALGHVGPRAHGSLSARDRLESSIDERKQQKGGRSRQKKMLRDLEAIRQSCHSSIIRAALVQQQG